MYNKILVALDTSSGDEKLIQHITELAKIHHSHLLLVHVADGWAARHFDELALKESEEMVKDREYINAIAAAIKKQAIPVTAHLALGEPAQEILSIAEKEKCDLIAMTSHGHGFFADIILGSAIEEVRHKTSLPLLVVSGRKARSSAQH